MENTVKDIYSEVYAILNMLGKEYINKLPNDIYNIIKEEKSTEYNPIYATTVALDKQDVKKETISIIAFLHLNYWCNEEEKIKYQKWEKIINVMAVVGLLILGIFITVPCCLDIPYLLSNNLVEVTGEVTQGAMSGENSNSERRIHIRDEKTGEEHSLKYWGTGSDLGDKITVRYLPHTEYGYVVE